MENNMETNINTRRNRATAGLSATMSSFLGRFTLLSLSQDGRMDKETIMNDILDAKTMKKRKVDSNHRVGKT